MEIKKINAIKNELDELLLKKLMVIEGCIVSMSSLIVAYSGGVDSSFLLKVSLDLLKDNVLAVMGISDTYPSSEIKNAKYNAELLGAKFLAIETCELSNEKFVSNPPDRCYYCKNELFTKLLELAKKKGILYVSDGSNYEDLNDYRPGIKAASDIGIRSPLIESEFTKKEIIEISRILGLPTWDKPPQPCLSSRFPYGTRITKERLNMVEQAEEFLSQLGFKYFRVRYHNEVARIEVQRDDLLYLLIEENSKNIWEKFREIGFIYTAIDILGYRSGSMNEMLSG